MSSSRLFHIRLNNTASDPLLYNLCHRFLACSSNFDQNLIHVSDLGGRIVHDDLEEGRQFKVVNSEQGQVG